MGRIRTIKPEFFEDEKLYDAEVEEKLPLRLAYAGLWTEADREGRFEYRARKLKKNVLPYDDVDFSRVLDALITRGFIQKYEVDGRVYCQIRSWHRHQVINNREKESEIPEPIEDKEDIDASSTREARVEHASKAEGKGREGKGKEEHSSFDKEQKKSSYPPEFETFWSQAYPVRPTDTKKLAFKAWEKGCKAIGADQLLKAAKAYAAFCSEKNHESMLVATWVNREGWTAALRASKPNFRVRDIQQREQDWYGSA